MLLRDIWHIGLLESDGRSDQGTCCWNGRWKIAEGRKDDEYMGDL